MSFREKTNTVIEAMMSSPQWRRIGRLWLVLLGLLVFVVLFVLYAPREPKDTWGAVRACVVGATGICVWKVFRRLNKVTKDFKDQLQNKK